jgi:hypothetical protein
MTARDLVPKVLLTTGVVFTVVGIGLVIAGETVLGVIVAAVGVTDLVTVPFMRGALGAKARQAERARIEVGDAGATPEADPSHNPYARED